MPFVLVFAAAFVLALTLTPLARLLGQRYGFVATPGGRRTHAGTKPRLGGLALFVAFVAAAVLAQFLPVERQDPKELTRLVGLLLGGAFIFLVGIYDDKRELRAFPQITAQLVAALIAIQFLIFIEYINNPFTNQQTQPFPWPFVVAFTLFWLMGMMNTVNWLDGLDGLAAGVAAIISAVLAFHMYREGQHSVALLPLALLGATLGFLPYNFRPAKVFMGSSGSFFLGFVVGALGIMAGAKMATVLLVMGIPILDVAWLIFQRWRRGGSPLIGDRSHLHFRLLDLGLSQRQIVLLYYLFCSSFGFLALLISSRIYKFLALLVLGAVTLVLLFFVSRKRDSGL
ncbi:MAG: undecaprenyl/decaprenyl-phosphate alpha-N-acetylglucosaminyl 1-phosphate transferase [Anaerolineales bacterium]|nr:undecaprenyl/decaprenyl-phosphate alpha-N-acetylglucosaminyl 1-phosphate transferase [Anaerolineales bacterium]